MGFHTKHMLHLTPALIYIYIYIRKHTKKDVAPGPNIHITVHFLNMKNTNDESPQMDLSDMTMHSAEAAAAACRILAWLARSCPGRLLL